MNIRGWLLAAVLYLMMAPPAAPADCKATSPQHSVALVELYTSEGCDSCPPADRWLSKIDDVRDADRVVALALHVDYWDRLGWKDRFASATYTERQREQTRRQGAAFVYTPQVLLDGRDFQQWHSESDAGAAIAAINAKPARARLELEALPDGHTLRGGVRVRVDNARDRAHASIAVALVQNGQVSEVKSGENAGKRLAHDHVVRQWRITPLAFDAAGETQQQFAFAMPAERGGLSIVAFVENALSGDVLQVASLPLCGPAF